MCLAHLSVPYNLELVLKVEWQLRKPGGLQMVGFGVGQKYGFSPPSTHPKPFVRPICVPQLGDGTRDYNVLPSCGDFGKGEFGGNGESESVHFPMQIQIGAGRSRATRSMKESMKE